MLFFFTYKNSTIFWGREDIEWSVKSILGVGGFQNVIFFYCLVIFTTFCWVKRYKFDCSHPNPTENFGNWKKRIIRHKTYDTLTQPMTRPEQTYNSMLKTENIWQIWYNLINVSEENKMTKNSIVSQGGLRKEEEIKVRWNRTRNLPKSCLISVPRKNYLFLFFPSEIPHSNPGKI